MTIERWKQKVNEKDMYISIWYETHSLSLIGEHFGGFSDDFRVINFAGQKPNLVLLLYILGTRTSSFSA